MNSPIHLQQREAVLTVPKIPVSPMGAIWRTIRGYILWSYERGSLHYDIMVTLILLFVFVTPHYVNFKDRPVERTPSATGVLIIPGDKGGFLYQIPAAAITTAADPDLRDQFQRIIEPIAGAVSITKYEPVKDATGHTQSYRVWVNKD
jgi:hypothetical protein